MQTLGYRSETAGQSSGGAVIRTAKLTKRFKKALAVNNVDFEVNAGDVFGLLGPNGAGKTTIIRMLLGLIAPSAGEAKVFGFDPIRDREEVLARVSAIVEAPALYPGLTGRDNLRAMAQMVGLENPERKIDEVLEKMNLATRAKDRFSTYSLGMKQRLCIAAALLTDPELIILDEPTNGLDPAGMAEIRQLIKELAGQGRTVMLSSHLLNEVQMVCNRVAIIQRGQIIAQGFVSDLLGSKSLIEVRVPAGEQERAALLLSSQGWGRRVRTEGEYLLIDGAINEGAALNRALVTGGIFASEITPRSQSLEEYYLELTGDSLTNNVQA
jgi:ABC-2 type transport system ATP-binding protein